MTWDRQKMTQSTWRFTKIISERCSSTQRPGHVSIWLWCNKTPNLKPFSRRLTGFTAWMRVWSLINLTKFQLVRAKVTLFSNYLQGHTSIWWQHAKMMSFLTKINSFVKNAELPITPSVSKKKTATHATACGWPVNRLRLNTLCTNSSAPLVKVNR